MGETCTDPFERCLSRSSIPRCPWHIQGYVLPEQVFSSVAENELGTDLVSGCEVLSTLSEILPPCFGVFCLIYLISSYWAQPSLDRK